MPSGRWKRPACGFSTCRPAGNSTASSTRLRPRSNRAMRSSTRAAAGGATRSAAGAASGTGRSGSSISPRCRRAAGRPGSSVAIRAVSRPPGRCSNGSSHHTPCGASARPVRPISCAPCRTPWRRPWPRRRVRRCSSPKPGRASSTAISRARCGRPPPGGIGREAWIPDDALRLEAAVPLLAQAAMLRLAERLEEHRSEPPPPRCGPFVTREDLD